MSDDNLPVEKEVIIATESVPANQKSLGRPMIMLLVLIGAAIAGIAILMAVFSN